MSKIIIVDSNKNGVDANQVFNGEASFSVIKKNEEIFQISINTDKGLVSIELNNEEIEQLLNKINQKL
ncbi:hypothetical protein CMT89_13450 [Elizabethkingia anophelis]|uniref:hypothetical protein n=1 Tax=Elizabethkingia anophelis TaxID=1117645 RepID=UPI000CE9843F|nr:hypothetical protein [Elizabethkingia anophelis]AVF47858.1 hypothetical protein AL491_07085 [Elizabethkingia anophelis]AVF51850.1 hypothetical protein AL492_09495 [Elizabethkingia anophelis]MBG0505454.1 hypothetical protein [Elizabethkingia anophelis]MCT3663828.1 hypothetical protein [Elizabethkingia anophelis]MCT4074315.1 hypothetical protein [Elizabethkingia anophelis]